jgi:hypothetical protein
MTEIVIFAAGICCGLLTVFVVAFWSATNPVRK